MNGEPGFTLSELFTCSWDSDLYKAMVARMKLDGRYKYKDRGISGRELNKISSVKALSITGKEPSQVWLPYKDDSEFSEDA